MLFKTTSAQTGRQEPTKLPPSKWDTLGLFRLGCNWVLSGEDTWTSFIIALLCHKLITDSLHTVCTTAACCHCRFNSACFILHLLYENSDLICILWNCCDRFTVTDPVLPSSLNSSGGTFFNVLYFKMANLSSYPLTYSSFPAPAPPPPFSHDSLSLWMTNRSHHCGSWTMSVQNGAFQGNNNDGP